MSQNECSYEFWECRASIWIWKVIPFTLLFVGTIGNIFNVLVLKRRELRRFSASMYMLILAISDTVALWTILLESTLKYGYDVNVIDLTSFQCRTAGWAAFSFGAFSTWTVANMTVERVVMTRFPFWAKKHIKPKVALITSSITFILIQGATAYFLYGQTHMPYKLAESNVATTALRMCHMVSPEYGEFFVTTWNQIVLFAFNIVPMCVIITGSSIIGISLLLQPRRHPFQQQYIHRSETGGQHFRQQSIHRSETGRQHFRQQSIHRSETGRHSFRQQSNHRSGSSRQSLWQQTIHESDIRRRCLRQQSIHPSYTRMDLSEIITLILFAFLFVVCKTPYCIFFVLLDFNSYSPNKYAAAIDKLTLTVVYILLFISYTINFKLYNRRGTEFRKQWKQMVNEWKNKLTRCAANCHATTNIVRPLQTVTPILVTTVTGKMADRNYKLLQKRMLRGKRWPSDPNDP